MFYSKKFEKAIDCVLTNEEGCVFDKNDPGGVTKYGISQRSYPSLNIKALSMDKAKKIYYCDYWLKGKFVQIPDENVATQLFDLSMNLEIRAMRIVLQRALRAVGKIANVVLYRCYDKDRIFIVVHHLIIDGVSWRILLDDIETTYKLFLNI